MTHASLFSGIGGPEVAAAMLGWDNLFHCEINEFCRRVLDYWFPNSKSYDDITKTDFSEWRGKVDVLTGGFPCQPFSYAGKRGGANDDRYLWPQMLRAIDEIRPTWVVGENVAGITTMVEPGEVSTMGTKTSLFGAGDDIQRYQYRQPFTIERICKDIESLGYTVQPVLIPACAVGAPHRRDRVFIVARRVEAVSEDTMHGGQLHRPNDEQGSERNIGNVGAGGGERLCGETSGTVAAERTIANTYGKRPDKPDIASEPGQPQRLDSQEDHTSGTAGLGRWDSFPAVSPVHRGNDGIPFDVDRLSIPFSKWRTESLKAYGNAIVPQVMYEILRAIDIITTKTIKQ